MMSVKVEVNFKNSTTYFICREDSITKNRPVGGGFSYLGLSRLDVRAVAKSLTY